VDSVVVVPPKQRHGRAVPRARTTATPVARTARRAADAANPTARVAGTATRAATAASAAASAAATPSACSRRTRSMSDSEDATARRACPPRSLPAAEARNTTVSSPWHAAARYAIQQPLPTKTQLPHSYRQLLT